MKEEIEAKVGCTIEEYYERMLREWGFYGKMETEEIPKKLELTAEEFDFIEQYMRNKVA